MKEIKNYIISSFVFALILVSFPFCAKAATIGFSPASGSYNVGDTINIRVYGGTNSKVINAVSANIKFSNDTLSLSSISKAGSTINLWVQEPSFSNTDGVASFEGVILNGYTGDAANFVTLVFKAKTVGTATLKFNSASVLANDGNGTDVLFGKGTGSFKILKVEIKPAPKTTIKKEVVKPETPAKDRTIVISEIKNDNIKYSPTKFLITSPKPVVDKSYSIQIDLMTPIIWTDDGTHVFQAPVLENGLHIIKIMAVDTSSNTLSGFLNFSSTVLKIPSITYYPNNLYVDDFMVLKGIADSGVDVEIKITNTETGQVVIGHASTNGDGQFTYVPDNKIPAGTYSITARASTPNGVTSDYMSEIKITNSENKLKLVASKLSDYLVLLIPLIALTSLFIIVSLYSFARVRRYHRFIKNKLSGTGDVVGKSFNILNEDMEEEVTILRKIRSGQALSKEEQVFMENFKKDIKETEKVIKKELKDIDKNDSK